VSQHFDTNSIDPVELQFFIEERLDEACEGVQVPVAIAGMMIKCALGLNPNLNEDQLALIFTSVCEHLAMEVALAGGSQTIH
jgi:hypothetical protein